MSAHDEIRELCALYALGVLEEADRVRLEAHLGAGCAECEQELAACTEGVLALAASAPATPPSPALRARILQAVREPRASRAAAAVAAAAAERRAEPHPVRRPVVRFSLLAGLGWAAAVVFAVLGMFEQRAVHQLQAELGALRVRHTLLEQELAEERRWAAAMAAPTVRVAALAPTSAGKPAQAGWALYDPSSRRAILVLQNLEPEPGHDFELWGIGSRGPRSLGVIAVEPNGRAVVRLPHVADPADLTAFAVSYESRGGSPNHQAPTGPVVMVGSL
jgi:anti-sigma-K factor RskA